MNKPTNRNDLEKIIRRAFEIDRMLPPVKQSGCHSPLGLLVNIPDEERSVEDILEDCERSRINITHDDLELWETANEWLSKISGCKWAVVKKRCQGMGWKRIAGYLVKKEYSDRHLHRATLLRYFYEGLEEILRKI